MIIRCEVAHGKHPRPLRKRWCCITLVLVFLLLVIVLILAFTVFKSKEPTINLVSAIVDGITPRLSFPAIKIELNITMSVDILVYNPNHVSLKHGHAGKSLVFYRGQELGEVDLSPGRIPASGSETIRCRLTLEADEIGPELGNLIMDVVAGELEIDAHTRLPGRVTILGILRKHVVAVSNCQITIGVGDDLKILSQDCKTKVKF